MAENFANDLHADISTALAYGLDNSTQTNQLVNVQSSGMVSLLFNTSEEGFVSVSDGIVTAARSYQSSQYRTQFPRRWNAIRQNQSMYAIAPLNDLSVQYWLLRPQDISGTDDRLATQLRVWRDSANACHSINNVWQSVFIECNIDIRDVPPSEARETKLTVVDRPEELLVLTALKSTVMDHLQYIREQAANSPKLA